MSYVWALLGFCALIILHEGGHFAAAKAVGMRVEKFSLFFGPMIVHKTIGETEYGIGVIPLGGFVKITGMSPEEVFEEPSVEARAYVNQPVWKRIVVILAGPVVNIVIAFFLLFGLFLHQGAYNATAGPQEIAAIEAGSPAARAGLKPGDILVSVDGQTSAKGIEHAVEASHCPGVQTNGCVASPAVTFVVRRDSRDLTLRINPRYQAKEKRALIGFQYGPAGEARNLDVLSASRYSVSAMGQEVGDTFSILGRIWESKQRAKLQGVVGIYAITQQAVNQGVSTGLEILAEISLALGVFNLLPFLPLDGGHIFWAIVEKVRRRKASLLAMERASYVGLVLVLGLFVIGLSNSIHTLSHGGYHLP